MAEGEIGVIWQGSQIHQHQVVNVRIRTSVEDMRDALGEAGVSPEAFNRTISGVSSSKYLPCTLFIKGAGFGAVLKVLQDRGRCRPYGGA